MRLVQLPGKGCCPCRSHRRTDRCRVPRKAKATNASCANSPRGALFGNHGPRSGPQLTSSTPDRQGDQEASKQFFGTRSINGTAGCDWIFQGNSPNNRDPKEHIAGTLYGSCIWEASVQDLIGSRYCSFYGENCCEEYITGTRHGSWIWKTSSQNLIGSRHYSHVGKECCEEYIAGTRCRSPRRKTMQFHLGTPVKFRISEARWQFESAVARIDPRVDWWCCHFHWGRTSTVVIQPINPWPSLSSSTGCAAENYSVISYRGQCLYPNDKRTRYTSRTDPRGYCRKSKVPSLPTGSPELWCHGCALARWSAQCLRGSCQIIRTCLWRVAISTKGPAARAVSARCSRCLWKRSLSCSDSLWEWQFCYPNDLWKRPRSVALRKCWWYYFHYCFDAFWWSPKLVGCLAFASVIGLFF